MLAILQVHLLPLEADLASMDVVAYLCSPPRPNEFILDSHYRFRDPPMSGWGDLGLGCIIPLALVSFGSPILPGFSVPLGGRGEWAGVARVMTSLGPGTRGLALGAEEAPPGASSGASCCTFPFLCLREGYTAPTPRPPPFLPLNRGEAALTHEFVSFPQGPQKNRTVCKYAFSFISL